MVTENIKLKLCIGLVTDSNADIIEKIIQTNKIKDLSIFLNLVNF